MIFEVTPTQIESLDANQLVLLLRKLIHAELAKYGIPLRAGTVPTQITIPDGGDDGRVSWSDGPEETDWLPSRFTIFQSKKGKTTPQGLKKETWQKSSDSSDPKLNEALQEALAQKGSYVVVTATAVPGTNVDRRLEKIREGILATGHDPALLSAIAIYDCNRMADWANTHPAIALWLNSALRSVHLGGFQSYEDWTRSPDIKQIQFQNSEETRFVAKGTEVKLWSKDDETVLAPKSFKDIKELIETFLQYRGKAVRLVGPSGYGKTRLAHEFVSAQDSSQQAILSENQVIYCIYEDVKADLINVAREIADSGSRALLIVDDCPDEVYVRLIETVCRQGSQCLLITMNVETKTQGIRQNLVVHLNAASDELITSIANEVNKDASHKNEALIRELSQGFPKMAVLASQALEVQDEEMLSVESLVSRIIWGENGEDQSALESLSLLSLFTVVGVENDAAIEIEELALSCGKSVQQMYRELNRFVDRGVVSLYGDYREVQPVPLATRLASAWLENNPENVLEELFESLSDGMKLKMIKRFRWLSWADGVKHFARAQLSKMLPDEAVLNSEFGSKLLDRFVHLAPDATMMHLTDLLETQSIDDLIEFDSGRRNVIWALEKLVFRKETFGEAARLLLRLGAAENERWANNASNIFNDIYQLYLSGTEATPEEKLRVLDEGLSDPDERVRKICVASLGHMLKRDHFTRSGGSETIGAASALEDWEPRTYKEIWDYYRAALTRLTQLAEQEDDPSSKTALNLIGLNLRGLLSIVPLLDEVQCLINRLLKRYPKWNAPIYAVSEWLYFNGKKAEENYQTRLRAYYDELVPTDTLELLVLYSTSGCSDLHDPDLPYDPNGAGNYDYVPTRRNEIIETSPRLSDYFQPVIIELLDRGSAVASESVGRIAKHVDEPQKLLRFLLDSAIESPNTDSLVNFTRSIINGAFQVDPERGLACLQIALEYEKLSSASIHLLSAVKLNDDLMRDATNLVQEDVVSPSHSTLISSDYSLRNVDSSLVESFIKTLVTKGEKGAWAAVDFVGHVIFHVNLDEAWLVKTITEAITNPALFERSEYSSMDWYHWADLTKKLINGNHIEEEACLLLVGFVVSVIEVEEYHTQLSFEQYAKEILLHVASKFPQIVWEEYHRHRDTSCQSNNFRLESLFGADIASPVSEGILNSIPSNIYVPWMLEDKGVRLPFIIKWIRLFADEVDDGNTSIEKVWSPKFVEFIDEHVESGADLDILYSRFSTGSWIGSYADKLEAEREYLRRLKELSGSREVLKWIDRSLLEMEQQIAASRRQEENYEASYRA